jgi:hypothetical protein
MFLKIIHPFYRDKMDGTGGPVLTIKLGVLTMHTFLALINVIFCTSMGSFP